VQNVQMQLNGADVLSPDDQRFFESRTKLYIESYYSNEGKQFVKSFYTEIKVLRAQPTTPSTSLSQRRRLASSSTGILVTYDQSLVYRPLVENVNANNTLVARPFNNIILRNNYISYLQSTNRSAFMSIKSVELPVICERNCNDPGKAQNYLALIIGVSAGGGVAIILLIILLFCLCKRRSTRKKLGPSHPLIQRNSE
jgi:hypothetical protein